MLENFKVLYDPCEDCIVGMLCEFECELKQDFEKITRTHDYQMDLYVYLKHEELTKRFIKEYVNTYPLGQLSKIISNELKVLDRKK